MNTVLIGNLNINLVKSKFDQLKSTMLTYMDILVISKTKFDEVFLISQFSDGYLFWAAKIRQIRVQGRSYGFYSGYNMET